jgi:predicted MPP superfamily phosphohydrolase
MWRYRLMTALVFAIVFLIIDYYFFQAVINVSKNWSPLWKNAARYGFWIPTILSIVAMLWWTFDNPYRYSANFRNWVITGLVATYFSKLFGVVILLIDDGQRLVKWMARFFYQGTEGGGLPGEAISRSEFLSKAAIIASGVPLGAFAYGIISGAHDYRMIRQQVLIKDLPKAFDGFRLVHVSDIHTGSFWNKTAVKGGVEMILKEKPELIVFTGDLVNNQTDEVRNYIDVFNKLKAPFGVKSITGNHDYGDYRSWDTKEEKAQNFRDLITAHKELGFDLLLNQNRTIEVEGEKLGIIGVENWGKGRFSKYGNLEAAYKGQEETQAKILLSHDPSHWDEQVRPSYKDIDLMLSGHTHGFQFGVEIGGLKWSPSQYVYKQWAGLYEEGDQKLYVNRGFGYLGYPGRVGMPPEITVLELKRA